MKLTKPLIKFSPSALQKAGKFQFKIIALTFILLLMIISLKALLTCYNINDEPVKIVDAQVAVIQSYSTPKIETIQVISETEPIIIPTATPTPLIEEVEEEVEEEVIEYDSPETIFDWFSNEEIEMLYRLVEAEATSGSIDDKINVANVIFNRLFSNEFPDTIEGVVFQHKGKHYQFSCISDKRYYKVKVTEETKEAVYRAFIEPDTTDGALYFCNKADVKNLSYVKWFNSLTYVKTDDIGHSYYK